MIPDYQTLMQPVLRLACEGELKISDSIERLADEFNLSPEERFELLPSSGQTVMYNRAQWAKTYLKQAGLVEPTRRGYIQITNAGREVLNNPPARLDVKFLRSIPAFINHVPKSRDETSNLVDETEDTKATPEELLREAYDKIATSIAVELLDRLRSGTPAFFERAIVALLLAMGYGGSSEDAGRAIGQSGDDGVDGVIDQDPLGVDQIYIQAKRYAEGNQVGPSAIRDFFGSLSLKKAQKGIFVTTSGFSKSAIETARQIGARIVLIDAQQLGRLMVRHNVGCRDQEVLHIKRIDEDFFE